jgi:hypothetical protein
MGITPLQYTHITVISVCMTVFRGPLIKCFYYLRVGLTLSKERLCIAWRIPYIRGLNLLALRLFNDRAYSFK